MTLALALLGLDCRGLLNSPLVGTGNVDEAAFHARQLSYLRYAAQQGSSRGSVLNLINHLERSRVDPPYAPSFVVPVDTYDGIFLKFSRFENTSDFDLLYLLNLWLGYGSDPILAGAASRRSTTRESCAKPSIAGSRVSSAPRCDARGFAPRTGRP